MYIQAIMTFFIAAIALFSIPETYHPFLLKQKAIRMRKTTGNERYWHPHEEVKMNINNILTKHVSRPVMSVLYPLSSNQSHANGEAECS